MVVDVRSKRCGILLAVLAIATLGAGGTAMAIDLRVDIGVADSESHVSLTPNEIHAAFDGFSIEPQFDGGGPYDFVTPGVVATTQNIAGVDVSIVGGGNGAFFYDFVTEVSDTFGDLVEDGVFTHDSDLTVTLSGLPAGLYEMTAYHHLADNTELLNWPPPGFDIYVNAGSGEFLAVSDVIASTGFGSAPLSITTSNFQFNSTGADVVVRLDGDFMANPRIPTFLNGFTIVDVPEPASSTLLALGMIAMVIATYTRGSQPSI